jgi:hypothetical protein
MDMPAAGRLAAALGRPGQMLRVPMRMLLVGFLLCGAGACWRRDQPGPPEPRPSMAPPLAPAFRGYQDAVFSFTAPGEWRVEPLAGQPPGLHVVVLTHSSGLYARLTLIRSSPAARQFPAQVIDNLRRAEAGLAVEEQEKTLAGRAARGFAYTFRKDERSWAGWIVSVATAAGELCVLAQHPAGEGSLERELDKLCSGLRVKEPAAQAPPAP